MDPTVRYDLRPGEWRPDPPHVAYGCDRAGRMGLLEAEPGAATWARDHPRAGGEHDQETVRRPALQSAPSPPVPDGCCPCRTSSRPGSRSRADQRAQTGRETVRERVLERSMSHGRPTRHRPCSGCRAPSCRRWPPARPLLTLRRMSARNRVAASCWSPNRSARPQPGPRSRPRSASPTAAMSSE